MSIYAIVKKTTEVYVLYKLDEDFRHIETYTVSTERFTCDCPAGRRTFCRHKRLINVVSRYQKWGRFLVDFDRSKLL